MRRHGFVALLLAAAALSGCKQRSESSEASAAAGDEEAPAPAAEEARIDWSQDDFDAALARAKEQARPLVVDMWAPWCHTCLSMKHYVLGDPGLLPMADRFVWVAIDTDKAENAEAVEELPVDVWPTFYVVSPVDGSVQARHLGAASVGQFREFLLQGEKGHLEVRAEAGKLARNSLLWHVRAGDRAAAAGDTKAAAESYLLAFEAAPDDYVRLPGLMVSIASSLYDQEEWERCVDFAIEHEGSAANGNTAAAADFAYYAAECAEEIEDESKKQVVLSQLSAMLGRVLAAGDSALSLDDRSYALQIVRRLALDLGDEARAKKTAEEQRALLDRAFKEAPNPHAAMTYGWHLAEVYVYLGEPAKVVPKLEELVEKLPKQYDPPHRLAWVYLQMEEHDKALAMAEKALERVYGPRKARVQKLIARIHHARGDRGAEAAALEALVGIYEELPEGQKKPAKLAEARKELAELVEK